MCNLVRETNTYIKLKISAFTEPPWIFPRENEVLRGLWELVSSNTDGGDGFLKKMGLGVL